MRQAWIGREERERLEFVEAEVETIFVTGAAYSDIVDGLAYVTYYVDQPGPRGTEHVFRVRLVMPVASIIGTRETIDKSVALSRGRLDG